MEIKVRVFDATNDTFWKSSERLTLSDFCKLIEDLREIISNVSEYELWSGIQNIYENDIIVKKGAAQQTKYVVQYSNASFIIVPVAQYINNPEKFIYGNEELLKYHKMDLGTFEVIGNIHQNKNLLK